MKIAYVFANDMAATHKLSSMILPQLESDSHIVQVVGMFFFCLLYTSPSPRD